MGGIDLSAPAAASAASGPVDASGVLTVGGNVMGKVLAVAATSSNVVRSASDRPASVAHQLSPSRSGRVAVSVTLNYTIGTAHQAVAQLLVGADPAAMVEHGVEGEHQAATGGILGAPGLLSQISLSAPRTSRRMLYADLPPGHFYKVVLASSGSGTATLNYVKERVF